VKDGYKYSDGKIIAYDYDKFNNKCEIEMMYRDNIEELLMAENVKEYLYNYKDEVNNYINTINREINKWKEERTGRIVVSAVVTFFVSLFSILFFKPILVLMVVLLGSILGIKFGIDCNRMIKKNEKKLDGAKLLLEGIEEEIEKNKIELRRLENDDRVEKEDVKGRNYVQLDYVRELKKLRNYLELWRVVGEEEEKFLKYDKRDKMYTLLEDDYEQEDIRIMRRILNRNKRKY